MKNEFKQGIETKQHQHYEAISATIGRDARPVKQLNPPVFEEALQTTWNSEVPFIHSISKPDFRRF